MTLLRTGVPPLACFAVDFFQHVGSGKSRDGYEADLLLDDITAGLQEGLELRDALVEALALPLDLRVTHVASAGVRSISRHSLRAVRTPSRRRRVEGVPLPLSRHRRDTIYKDTAYVL